MYPLIGGSVILIALAIERAIMLRRAGADGDDLLERVKELFAPGGDAAQAMSLCDGDKTPMGRMFGRGLRNAARDADAIEMAMEQEAANDAPMLEANLPLIKTIATIAPLMGLLGTIAGMISAFRAASQKGLSNPTEILGGISEALISTATGITLAIVAYIAFNYFANLARKITEDMEYYGAELINYITGRID